MPRKASGLGTEPKNKVALIIGSHILVSRGQGPIAILAEVKLRRRGKLFLSSLQKHERSFILFAVFKKMKDVTNARK